MRLGDAAEHEERSRLKFTLIFDCGRVLFCGGPAGRGVVWADQSLG